jgi:hypothetical protein
MTTPDPSMPPPVRPPLPAPTRRRPPKDHLTIRIGSLFEASAGGRIAVVLLGLVAVVYIVAPALQRLLQ